jgi:general transcription factor 3C polypeptide 3 (transcription factor C subunit 4)
MHAYTICGEQPLLMLCLGITHLHLAMQRKTPNRNLQIIQVRSFAFVSFFYMYFLYLIPIPSIVFQAFALLYRYFQLRKGNQEACYNLGRAFQHVQLFPFAIHYYELALQQTHDSSDWELSRETTYNLASIYIQIGATFLAEELLRRYCTIS